MSFIKSILKKYNPPIKIEHFRSVEGTKSGKIQHDFIDFDVEKADITTVFAARMLAKRIGQKISPFLDKLIKNTKDRDKQSNLKKTETWIYKKTVWHPALVEKSAYKVLEKMKKGTSIKKIGLPYKQIRTDAVIATILHDIGRLSEIDIYQGRVILKRGKINKSHAAMGFDALKHSIIKPEILLAIRYHEFADTTEAKEDKIYQALPDERKRAADFYIKLLQDADKAGNLIERSVYGAKKTMQYFSPDFVKDYDLTDKYLKAAMSGNYFTAKKGHLLDVMIHYMVWSYDVHYKGTRKILVSILSDLFMRIYEEALDEYHHSEDKNAKRLANTLEKITKFEDYVICQRLNRKINEKNRRKIREQIAKLRCK